MIGAEGAGAIIAGQYANVVIETGHKLADARHRGAAHFDMQIAEMQDGEAFECVGQTRRGDEVAPQFDPLGVSLAARVKAAEAQGEAHHRMHRVPVLDMEEIQALPEGLRLMVLLDADALARMDLAEALLEAARDLE